MITLLKRLSQKSKTALTNSYDRIHSSSIHSTRLDASSGQMYIRFHDGTELLYYRVPEKVYASLLKADQPNHFYEAFIKNRYNSFRIT